MPCAACYHAVTAGLALDLWQTTITAGHVTVRTAGSTGS
jgi:hypothetical protein